MGTESLRVLMSCYACEPGKGSEPGVGWHWALQAARVAEVWVLTRSNNRPAIEAELTCHPVPNLHFVYHDLPRWARIWKRGQQGVRLYYLLWQLTALVPARSLHRRIGFDVIHHVTFNSIDNPGFLWLLPSRFVWGPVGGGQVPPAALKQYFGPHWRREQIRTIRKRALRFNPLVRAAIARSQWILAANKDTERLLLKLGARRVSRELETAVQLPAGSNIVHAGQNSNGTFTVIWAGSLIPLKAPNLALDVIDELLRRGVQVKMIMIGEGSLRSSVEQTIRSGLLQNNVTLAGSVPFSQMSDYYQQGDAFLFTSLRDTSGNVVLEAMAHGLPVITLDHQGSAEMVTSDCGFKVPVGAPSSIVQDMATAIETLVRSPDLHQRMSAAARRRAETAFNWDRKGELLQDIYTKVRP